MKKQLAYILTAVLIFTNITACNDDQTEIQSYPNSAGTSLESAVISNTDSTESPENSIPEEKKPDGEPTIYTAPEGVPVYTGEITKALDWLGSPISPDEITLDEESEIFCEGFQYFKEPIGVTFDGYHNPEMFGEMEFTGDMPQNNNPFKRLYVGDEICGLKLTKAVSHFTNSGGKIGFNNTINNYGGTIAEFEGTVTLEGFLFITPPNNYEPDGGRLEFDPVENKLPLLSCENGGEPMLISAADGSLYILGEFGGLHLEQDKFTYTDIEGMGIGDLAFVRATVSGFCYTNGGGRRAALENVEVLSDVIKHIDRGF